MSNQIEEYRPVIFLDTNILHNIGSYLRIATQHQFPPIARGGMTYEDIRQDLRGQMPRGIADGVLDGCKALAYLQRQSGDPENGAVIYTSRLSKSEMLFGVLDGKAHARMAREGIPYRMRQRLSDLSELVLSRLDPNDYNVAVNEIGYVFQYLGEHLTPINYVEDANNIRDVASLSEFLQGKIFLDVIDCWIYAGSLIVQSRYFLTLDGYLKKTANRIYQPMNETDIARQGEWLTLRSDIQDYLRGLFRWDANQDPLVPEVVGFPDGVPSIG